MLQFNNFKKDIRAYVESKHDINVDHDTDVCEDCATCLEETQPVKVIKRQVFDVPK